METTTDPSVEAPLASGADFGPRTPAAHENLAPTAVFRGAALALGLALIAFAAGIALVAANVVRVPDSWFHAPRLVVGLVGAGTFGLAGLAFALHGARDVVRRRRAARERTVAPETPWRWDRVWFRGGEDAPRWRRARRAAAGAAMFCALLASGVAVAFTTDAPAVVRGGVALSAAIGLVPIWIAVRRATEAMRFGRTFVRWAPFPAFVGERITLRFGVTRERLAFSRLTFRLRCVTERVVESQESDGSHTAAVSAFVLHEATRSLDAPGDMPRPHVEAVLSFEIPAGLPGNALGRDLPTYWELEVLGDAPGLGYRMQFLLPVYERG